MTPAASAHVISCAVDHRTHHYLCALTGTGWFLYFTIYVLIILAAYFAARIVDRR